MQEKNIAERLNFLASVRDIYRESGNKGAPEQSEDRAASSIAEKVHALCAQYNFYLIGTPEERYAQALRDAYLNSPGLNANLDALEMSIDALNLHIREMNTLRRAGYAKVGDLAKQTKAELMLIPGLGAKSIAQIETYLVSHDLSLALRVSELHSR